MKRLSVVYPSNRPVEDFVFRASKARLSAFRKATRPKIDRQRCWLPAKACSGEKRDAAGDAFWSARQQVQGWPEHVTVPGSHYSVDTALQILRFATDSMGFGLHKAPRLLHEHVLDTVTLN